MNWYGRSLASGFLAALAGLTSLSPQALAQSYPTRSITMIVPFAAGGPTDVIARIVTGHMAHAGPDHHHRERGRRRRNHRHHARIPRRQ
jgi:hypothetical protein